MLMFLVHLFAVYTIRRPRYTIKRLTALLHIMTGKYTDGYMLITLKIETLKRMTTMWYRDNELITKKKQIKE